MTDREAFASSIKQEMERQEMEDQTSSFVTSNQAHSSPGGVGGTGASDLVGNTASRPESESPFYVERRYFMEKAGNGLWLCDNITGRLHGISVSGYQLPDGFYSLTRIGNHLPTRNALPSEKEPSARDTGSVYTTQGDQK